MIKPQSNNTIAIGLHPIQGIAKERLYAGDWVQVDTTGQFVSVLSAKSHQQKGAQIG